MSFWYFYYQLWTYFRSFSSASIVDFEKINVCCEGWSRVNRISTKSSGKVNLEDYETWQTSFINLIQYINLALLWQH